jgi:hypothetical protein
MATQYKVWIEVERCDEGKDEYRTLDLPFASVVAFNTEDDAIRFATCLNDLAIRIVQELRGTPRRGRERPHSCR